MRPYFSSQCTSPVARKLSAKHFQSRASSRYTGSVACKLQSAKHSLSLVQLPLSSSHEQNDTHPTHPLHHCQHHHMQHSALCRPLSSHLPHPPATSLPASPHATLCTVQTSVQSPTPPTGHITASITTCNTLHCRPLSSHPPHPPATSLPSSPHATLCTVQTSAQSPNTSLNCSRQLHTLLALLILPASFITHTLRKSYG